MRGLLLIALLASACSCDMELATGVVVYGTEWRRCAQECEEHEGLNSVSKPVSGDLVCTCNGAQVTVDDFPTIEIPREGE